MLKKIGIAGYSFLQNPRQPLFVLAIITYLASFLLPSIRTPGSIMYGRDTLLLVWFSIAVGSFLIVPLIFLSLFYNLILHTIKKTSRIKRTLLLTLYTVLLAFFNLSEIFNIINFWMTLILCHTYMMYKTVYYILKIPCKKPPHIISIEHIALPCLISIFSLSHIIGQSCNPNAINLFSGYYFFIAGPLLILLNYIMMLSGQRSPQLKYQKCLINL